MIKNWKEYNYCIYIHSINGVVFYVGCGKKSMAGVRKYDTFRCIFIRPFEKSKRSQYWKDYVNGRDFNVEIISFHKAKKEAYAEEIRWILFYGRVDLSTGTLVNKSPGGGKFANGPSFRAVPIIQYDLVGNEIKTWGTVRSIQNETGFLKTNIVKCCRKRQVTAYGYKWAYKDNHEFDKIEANASRVINPKPHKKPLFDTQSQKSFKSKQQAHKELGVSREYIDKQMGVRFIPIQKRTA